MSISKTNISGTIIKWTTFFGFFVLLTCAFPALAEIVFESVLFHEGWETSRLGSNDPAVDWTIQGDEGIWLTGDTVGDSVMEGDMSCGPSIHRIDIVSVGSGRALKLISNESLEGCADNVWVDLGEYHQIGLNRDFHVPIQSNTVVSFEETGSLVDPQIGYGNKTNLYDCFGPPCFDNVNLTFEDVRGNILTYVMQRAPKALPNDKHSCYREIFLNPAAGKYSRNLFEDFSTIPDFNPSGAELAFVVFGIDEHGWAVVDNIKIGTGEAYPDETHKLFFPYVSTRDGWGAEICIVNSGNTALSGSLQAYTETGLLTEGFSVSLNPRGRTQLEIDSAFSEPDQIYYLVFESDKTTVTGYAKLYKDGRQRVALPATSSSEINSSDIAVTHIASTSESPAWATTISLLNTFETSTSVSIVFNNGETRSLDLDPGECEVFTVARLFGSAPGTAVTSATIENANGIIGVELFGNDELNYLSGILLKDDATDRMYFPHIAIQDGWATGVVALNTSAKAANATITPYSAAGDALGSMVETIAPGERWFGVVFRLGLPEETAWIDVKTAQKAIAGFELFSRTNQMAGYTGVDIAKKDGVFPKIEKDGGTGLAFVNIGDSTAKFILRACDDSGNLVAIQSFYLSKYEKFVETAQKIFGQNIDEATYIYYSSDNDIVGFQLNGSSDSMMLDALPTL